MDSRRKNRGNVGHFSAEELEVAEVLLSLCEFRAASILQWGVQRKRSSIFRSAAKWILRLQGRKIGTTGSPINPLHLNGRFGSDAHHHYGEANLHPTLPQLPSARRLSPTTQKRGQVVNPRRRAPKRKTHGELTEMVKALLVENEKLKKDKMQLLKTRQALQDWNKLSKPKMLQLARKQESPLASMQAPLDDPDSGHKTKTTICSDKVPILNGHGCSKIISDALPIDLACKQPCSNGRLTCQHSPEFPCHSEKGLFPTYKECFSCRC